MLKERPGSLREVRAPTVLRSQSALPPSVRRLISRAFLPKPFKAPLPVPLFVSAGSCSCGVGSPAACNGADVEVSVKLATQVPQRSKDDRLYSLAAQNVSLTGSTEMPLKSPPRVPR